MLTCPVAVDDQFQLVASDETTAALEVLSNDTSPECGETPLLINVLPPEAGTANVNPDGTIQYTAPFEFLGTDTFTYEVSDGEGNQDAGTVTVAVVNGGPQELQNDTIMATTGEPVMFNVLENDIDPTGQLALSMFSQPESGVVTSENAASGLLTYVSNDGFIGTDVFTYTASNGSPSSTATVTILVSSPGGGDGEDPVAQDDFVATLPQTPVIISVLENDTDPDGDQLTIINAASEFAAVEILGGTQLSYSPADEFCGTDVFNYTVSDGTGRTDQATVSVRVEGGSPPPVARDDTASTVQGVAIDIDVLVNDTDVDGDPLTIIEINSLGENSEITINANQTVRYVPLGDFFGQEQFTYVVSDGTGATAVATVTVTIGEQVLPVARPDSASASQGVPTIISPLDNDSDPDGDALSITQVASPNATVQVNPDQTLTYTANADFTGIDVFNYTISDGNGTMATGTITVEVGEAQNRPPAAQDDTVLTLVNTPLTINVLENDVEPDGDALQINEVVGGQGNIQVNADFSLTYTPPLDFVGTDEFRYIVSDGLGATDEANVMVRVQDDSAIRVLDVEINTGFVDPADLPTGPQPTSWATQRSEIRRLQINFDQMLQQVAPEDIRLTNLGVDAAVDPDEDIDLTDSNIATVSTNASSIVIDFAPYALSDGVYELEVSTTVRSIGGGQLETPFVFTGSAANSFYVLATDWNGDQGATVFDISTLAYWFGIGIPTGPGYVDCNQDNGISVFDFTCLATNFGSGVQFPVARPVRNVVAPEQADSIDSPAETLATSVEHIPQRLDAALAPGIRNSDRSMKLERLDSPQQDTAELDPLDRFFAELNDHEDLNLIQ